MSAPDVSPEAVQAMKERLCWHSEHPVTGKLRLTNPDGPRAATMLEDLLVSLTAAERRAEGAEAERDEWRSAASNGTVLLNLAAREIASLKREVEASRLLLLSAAQPQEPDHDPR